MVIDLSPMKSVTVDPASKTALVSTGNNAGEILASTARFGLAPVLGECPTVGAGLALGGGLGWLSGLHGATCDNLLAARLITADAKVLDVDDSRNPDLIWAIRGGGGNFEWPPSFNIGCIRSAKCSQEASSIPSKWPETCSGRFAT